MCSAARVGHKGSYTLVSTPRLVLSPPQVRPADTKAAVSYRSCSCRACKTRSISELRLGRGVFKRLQVIPAQKAGSELQDTGKNLRVFHLLRQGLPARTSRITNMLVIYRKTKTPISVVQSHWEGRAALVKMFLVKGSGFVCSLPGLLVL